MTRSSRALEVTEAEDDGQRADVVLGRRMPGLSRRMARRMALDGHVRLDGRRIAPSTRVRLGQVLEIVWTVHEDAASTSDVEILAVTDDYVFAAKPAGLHTHRLRPDQPPTLADHVALHHPECTSASPDPREGGAVHRLDLETSGVVVFARNRAAWNAARRAFASGAVHKRYLAICHAPKAWPPPDREDLPGFVEPEAGTDALWVRAPIGRGPRRDRAAVSLRGPKATTRIERLSVSADGSFVLAGLDLVTGRRHQARVHLAFVGMPIVGDVKYGRDDGSGLPLMLHAAWIDLGPLARPVAAPLSDAFADFLAAHGMPRPDLAPAPGSPSPGGPGAC